MRNHRYPEADLRRRRHVAWLAGLGHDELLAYCEALLEAHAGRSVTRADAGILGLAALVRAA